MAKKSKKQSKPKTSKFMRICERCGNENFSFPQIYRCPFCGWKNGVGKS